VETAATVWHNMTQEFKWTERYTRRVRTMLARTLREVVPALAIVVNPSLRINQQPHVEFTGPSQAQNFGILMCLPRSTHKRHPGDTMFRLMERIASGFVDCLQTALFSK
jgi:hypothetical protein